MFGLYILLPSIRNGFRMCLTKSSGLSLLNSFHSVTNMQQSAPFKHAVTEVAYLILSPKIFLAFSVASGSYAIMEAFSFRS